MVQPNAFTLTWVVLVVVVNVVGGGEVDLKDRRNKERRHEKRGRRD